MVYQNLHLESFCESLKYLFLPVYTTYIQDRFSLYTSICIRKYRHTHTHTHTQAHTTLTIEQTMSGMLC